MVYIGIDLHRKRSQVTALDESDAHLPSAAGVTGVRLRGGAPARESST